MAHPHLEYGSCSWSPRLKKEIELIVERVQQRAAKLVPGLTNDPLAITNA